MGEAVETVKPGDRVTVNVETFCGQCFFCQRGFVNNCEDPEGGWALGCRIDGGQAEYVRVPYADQGLNRIPDGVSDRQTLFTGDILATGYWAARIIVCESDPVRRRFVQEHYPDVLTVSPAHALEFVRHNSSHGGADVVMEVAGTADSFRMAWECARPNATVTIVALYDRPQVLPLPDMYGKNLTFKTGGVDGCDCAAILRHIAAGELDTTPLITHIFPLSEIDAAYTLFEDRRDNVFKIAITT